METVQLPTKFERSILIQQITKTRRANKSSGLKPVEANCVCGSCQSIGLIHPLTLKCWVCGNDNWI